MACPVVNAAVPFSWAPLLLALPHAQPATVRPIRSYTTEASSGAPRRQPPGSPVCHVGDPAPLDALASAAGWRVPGQDPGIAARRGKSQGTRCGGWFSTCVFHRLG